MDAARECNFDSIVGLTHNFAGLAYGNVASEKHQNQTSYPRRAARQGLEKMWAVAQLGIPQAVLPPLVRPEIGWLRRLGFAGDDSQVIESAWHQDPVLYAAACSASSMWAANAATVSPSSDTGDSRVHLTIANLNSSLHRSLEARSIEQVFRQIFAADCFQVHRPLPAAIGLTDEGAANHTRLAAEHGKPGLELFVYGRDALNLRHPLPRRYPARQTRQACEAIARNHQLDPENSFFFQQTPEAIDGGVFHNDVISVGHRDLLLVHQYAYLDQDDELQRLSRRFEERTGKPLQVCTIADDDLPLEDAVRSYLFNSQLLDMGSDRLLLLCPEECRENARALAVVERLVTESNPIQDVHFVDLRQSMNNGGGPACLRLRIVLDESERKQVGGRLWLDSDLFQRLVDWVDRYYPESLEVNDLANPELLKRSREANHALASLLDLDLETPTQAWNL